MNFKQVYNAYLEQFEDILDNNLPEGYNLIENLTESIRYSIKSGGKRLRPVLILSVCDMLGGNKDEIIPIACLLK